MNQKEREEREYISLFCDQRYAKNAWRKFIADSLTGPGKALPTIFDPKTDSPTRDSAIDQMAYENVKNRLRAEGKTREPMQAELLIENNVLRARFADGALTTILDRTAGKVKEEISLSDNPYEDLTDEELLMLKQHRDAIALERDAQKAKKDEGADA